MSLCFYPRLRTCVRCRYVLYLPRALLNCATSRKDSSSSSWSTLRLHSPRDLHTTPYSQCIITGKLNPVRTSHSLLVSPAKNITSFSAIYSHLQSHLESWRRPCYHCFSLRQSRQYSARSAPNTSTVRYIIATTIVVLGLSYAAVPLYRLFCQASGYGGTVTKVDAGEKVEKMEPIRERSITVR